MIRTADMAAPIAGARWPLDRLHDKPGVPTTGARAFGSLRDNGKRRTVGVTLPGVLYETVIAPIPGCVVARLPWHKGLYIVYVATDHYFIGLGELQRESMAPIGESLQIGGEVGKLDFNNAENRPALHFSLWLRLAAMSGTDFVSDHVRTGKCIWWTDRDPPPLLLDPTEFLRAAGNETWNYPARGARERYEHLQQQQNDR